MNEKTNRFKRLMFFFIKKTFKSLGSLLLVLILLLSKIIRKIGSSFESVAEAACVSCNIVYFAKIPEPAINEIIPTFTDQEIDLMAKKINNKETTLKEISDKFSISMRQAKKVKDRVNSAVDIHSFTL